MCVCVRVCTCVCVCVGGVCCRGLHVHRCQLLPEAEPGLLHDHHLHPQPDDRHAVLGLLLALGGRRPRQDLAWDPDRPHHDDADLRRCVLSAKGGEQWAVSSLIMVEGTEERTSLPMPELLEDFF